MVVEHFYTVVALGAVGRSRRSVYLTSVAVHPVLHSVGILLTSVYRDSAFVVLEDQENKKELSGSCRQKDCKFSSYVGTGLFRVDHI